MGFALEILQHQKMGAQICGADSPMAQTLLRRAQPSNPGKTGARQFFLSKAQDEVIVQVCRWLVHSFWLPEGSPGCV
jgi:hypothetical protein